MMRFFKPLRTMLAMIFVAWPTASPAWDGEKYGKISGFDVVANGDNFGFRVYMNGTPMCGTSEVWAFINKSASNYEAVVSTVTSAYLAGKNINILSNRNGIYCEIGYIQLR